VSQTPPTVEVGRVSVFTSVVMFQSYAEMDPTTAALEKEHEAVRYNFYV